MTFKGNGSRAATSTTEILDFDYGISMKGPDMPMSLASHDIVAYSDSVFMITGGRSSDSYYSANTFVYYNEVVVWEHGLTFNEARSDHISEIITDTLTGGKIMVIAGGFNGASMDSVELLYFGQDEERWIYGKI